MTEGLAKDYGDQHAYRGQPGHGGGTFDDGATGGVAAAGAAGHDQSEDDT